ncbi:MAG: hypothetical protein ACKO0M_06155, partial [Cyanobium sp.]
MSTSWSMPERPPDPGPSGLEPQPQAPLGGGSAAIAAAAGADDPAAVQRRTAGLITAGKVFTGSAALEWAPEGGTALT